MHMELRDTTVAPKDGPNDSLTQRWQIAAVQSMLYSGRAFDIA